MEVLLPQRDAIEATMELIETRKERLNALVEVYQAVGGGWNYQSFSSLVKTGDGSL